MNDMTLIRRHRLTLSFAVLSLVLASGIVTRAVTQTPAVQAPPADAARIARGQYLATTGHCHDCHTPWKMGARGPEPDMTRALSGHPSELVMPPAPTLPPGPWLMIAAATNTAWAGPWGVSFTANLTPDRETGLGDWTEEMFIQTMRTGKHQGKGRPLLPPMPYQNVGMLNDEDIRSLFAYLRSLTPIRNRVPAPVDAPEGGQ